MSARKKAAPKKTARKSGATAASSDAADSPALAFGKLVRIALFPSAIADVVTGLAIGFAGRMPEGILPWLLIPASLGIYHGAMALNDWSDREGDALTRPERPIPSGAISASLALFVAVVLVLGGVSWATAAGLRAGAWALVVAISAIVYDLAGRGAIRGPLLLGLCRAGNLGLGAAAPWLLADPDSGLAFPTHVLPLLVLYGAHVFSISALGRLEDDEDTGPLGKRPTRALHGVAATGLMLPIAATWAVGGSADVTQSTFVGLVLGLYLAGRNAATVISATRRGEEGGWTRADVGRSTGLCLSRLPYVSASIASAAALLGTLGLAAVAVAIAGGYVGGALRRVFPVT